MNRKLLLAALFCVFATAAFAQTAVTLDAAIKEATNYFLGMIPARSRVAIVNFAASGENISEYIINSLTKGLVDSRQVSIVERRQLDEARAEIKFGMSDEVSDESAVKAAQFVSAGVVVTGSIKPLGKNYYMQLRAIDVESGVSHGMFYQTVQAKDMARLFNTKPPRASNLYPKEPKPERSDYNVLQKFGIGLLNIPLGLGSYYYEPNTSWGSIIVFAELLGAFAGAGGIGMIVSESIHDPYWFGYGAAIGFGVGASIGFIRGFFVMKSGYKRAEVFPLDINIVSVSSNDNFGVQMTYTLSF